MSSPVREGTLVSTAFSSKDIDILSEIIWIKIDRDFQTAKFTVEYTIQNNEAGNQIPLLFYAQDYRDSFHVFVDGKPVPIQSVPDSYRRVEESPFSNFGSAFQQNDPEAGAAQTTIYWRESFGYVYNLSDLKYFETSLAKGLHKIKVEYTADAWTEISGWIKQYSSRYSLTPAKFWRSFGTLQVHLSQVGQLRELTTNLGLPLEKSIQLSNSWIFEKLPGEFISISFSETPNNLALVLIGLGPLGITIIITIALIALHLLLLIRFRRNSVGKIKYPVVSLGCILIPLISLLSFIFSFELIDAAIGPEAGGHHGYVFLIIIFYPLILPVYWLIIWLIDRHIKRKNGNRFTA